MPNFRSFSLSIQVDGKELPEYQTKYHDETKTATCWVPSEAGRRFTICYQRERSFNDTTGARVYLDGNERPVTKTFIGKGRGFSGKIKTVRTSPTTKRPLQFASLESTDDDSYLDSSLDLKAPGTIRVQIHRVRVTGRGDRKAGALPADRIVVHEKSKKAGGHVTGLGDYKSCRFKETTRLTKPLTPADRDPWVTFEFRYRSAAMLQAEGMMPKATRDQNEEIDERSKGGKVALKAEILDVDAAQASLDTRTAKVRAQHGHISLKRETSPTCVPRSVVGKVFDLASDD